MRLIDADAAIEAFGLSEKTRKYGGDHSGYNTMMLYEIQGVLDDLPTIEQPQTGKWMFSPDDAEGICTVCQYKIYGRPYQGRYLIVPYNFCPNCGARMVTE